MNKNLQEINIYFTRFLQLLPEFLFKYLFLIQCVSVDFMAFQGRLILNNYTTYWNFLQDKT
ncbi:hypothetical protein [Methylomonas fluvii]|nr:hypothetical protein [Methylomonas fluvii]